MRRPLVYLLSMAAIGAGAFGTYKQIAPPQSVLPISTGKFITPIDPGVEVGNYPCNMALSPDGRYVVATNTGSRQQLSVLDAQTGQLLSAVHFNRATPVRESLYFGLAFGPDGLLYVSRGNQDKISRYKLEQGGNLTHVGDWAIASGVSDKPNYPAGLAFFNGSLYVACNETYPGGSGTSKIAELDGTTGQVKRMVGVQGFPLSVVASGQRIWATNERDGTVSMFGAAEAASASIATGKCPSYLLAGKDGVWVSNSSSDTVSFIDSRAGAVKKTILVRPAPVRGLPSCMPLGMAEHDGKLLVACGDLNAVAVIDERTYKLEGYIPTGWLPTSLVVSGDKLFVANAKGSRVRTPNSPTTPSKGTYVLSVLDGTVSVVDLTLAMDQLPTLSHQVMLNNRYAEANRERIVRQAFKNPGIKHVIYIVKENRTYDQILGDMPEGSGDKSICLFPEEVTPNQHALARRFVLLDNFSVCGEVSADGWLWSTAGQVNEYASRNVPTNYSGRGRDYDEEGEVNGQRVDLAGLPNVSAPPGGYIWDLCRRSKVSMRNYGFFVGETDQLGPRADSPKTKVDAPIMKALQGITDVSFREFDMEYPDSQALEKYGFRAPKQMDSFGEHGSTNRFSEWKREFDAYVANGKLPQFTLLRLPRDHTSGTSPNLSSPRAMVADNDYAVGQVVEAVSHSPYWDSTAIFVIEDDAQAGMDHIDCHRSTCYVISPFVKRAFHDSRFYNTDSVLRTMELLCGMKPMNGYDAVADPLDVFSAQLSNSEPFQAKLPAKEIVCEVNKTSAYRAKDSASLISRFKEESMPDLELNDILWGDFKVWAARKR